MENRARYYRILKEINELFERIPKHVDGGILGSMTTWPHPIGAEVFAKFIHVNGNDPVVFGAVEEYERKLISEVGSLFDADHGLFTSGGTESNILALYIYKQAGKGRNNVVIAPSTAHKSIDKACKLMGCELVKIPTNPLMPVDPDLVRKYAKEHNPFAIVITAGTTEAGAIDPVEEAGEIAEELGIPLHVDAAYGGMLIPFLYKRGVLRTGLRMKSGVSSITVDMHKNGCAPIPSSILFLGDEGLRELACFDMDYMPSGRSCGLLGTRPGGALFASYFTWKAIGAEGYEFNAIRLMELAGYLHAELEGVPDIEVFPYTLPIIAFRSRRFYYEELLKELMRRELYLYKSPSLLSLRVVLMPHHQKRHVDRLISELRYLHAVDVE